MDQAKLPPLPQAASVDRDRVSSAAKDPRNEVNYVIHEKNVPRKLGYLEYHRRLDNPSIGSLFEDEEAREDMLSASLDRGATPVNVAQLHLIRRTRDAEPESDSSDEEELIPWLPPGGDRGYACAPLTPLGQALDVGLSQCSRHNLRDHPLLKATKAGDLAQVKTLLAEFEDGAKLSDATDHVGRGALIWGASLGHQSITKELVDSDKGAAELPDRQGNSALMWACREGEIEIARVLLDANLYVDHQNVGYLKSPLMWAAQQGHLRIVSLLLERGASVHLVCSEGCTALHYASRSGKLEVMKTLLHNGAEVNKEDIHQMTPLHYAAEKGHQHIVHFLLYSSTSNQETQDGTKPLCNVHVQNKSGQTALQLASNWISPQHRCCAELLQSRINQEQAQRNRLKQARGKSKPSKR